MESAVERQELGNGNPVRNGPNVARILSVVPEGIPQFANSNPKAAVKIDKSVSLPDAALDLLPGDYLSGVFQKDDEQTKRLLLYFDPSTLLKEFARCRIYFERAELVSSLSGRLHSSTPQAELAAEFITLKPCLQPS